MISIHINPYNPAEGDKLPFEKYKGGYLLTKDVSIAIGSDIKNVEYKTTGIDGESVSLIISNGVLYASKGFWWDGASGPTVDDSSNILSSLVHDILWELIGYCKEEKKKPPCSYRNSNELLMIISIRQGMEPWRAVVWFIATGTAGVAWRLGVGSAVNGFKRIFRKSTVRGEKK